MRETNNIHLTQWDPTDRILREKFNDDNAKIDAALGGVQTALGGLQASLEGVEGLPDAMAAKAGQLELIREYVPKNYAAELTVSLNYDTWNSWETVFLTVHHPQDAPGDTTEGLAVGLGKNSLAWTSPALAQPGYLLAFFPRHDPAAKVSGFIIADRFISFTCDFTYQNFDSVFLMSAAERTLPPYPHVLVYGRK